MPDTTPRSVETRWPCPVCVGLPMEKARLTSAGSAAGAAATLTIDYCSRCGGLWFERGEVGELARRPVADIRQHVPERHVIPRPPCHGCHAPLDRDAERCPACGHANILQCPACDLPMERRSRDGVVLDLCRSCLGVWFDHAELTAIWRIQLTHAVARRGSDRGAAGAVAGDGLLHAMFWAPDLVVGGGTLLVHGAGAAVEVAGEAAEGVFSVILEIIASIFE